MVSIERSLHLTTLTAALALGLTFNFDAPGQAQSQPASLSRSIPERWEAFRPPGRGTPTGRQGGATRKGSDNCLPINKSLEALVPVSGMGRTVAGYPTFSWYVPTTSARAVEFVLHDENDSEIYTVKLAIAGTPGVMSLSLPADAGLPPLEIGKQYNWQLALVCDASERDRDISVKGSVTRVELTPTLARKIQSATLQERVAIYADDRLWYETLTALVELRRLYPNDPTLKDAWAKLLNSVDLDSVAGEPLNQSAALKDNFSRDLTANN